jgi:hypothetical protein
MSFDLTVDKRDSKSGRVVSSNPYTRYASADGVVYLRDGVYYTESGQIASEDLIKRVVGKEAKLETPVNTLKK